ncbi:MAG TPA: hypothetical protein VGF80_05715 [Galbitalea sp.]
MSTMRRRIAIPLALILAVSSVPVLTGCFGNPVQGAINAATGGKVNLGGGGSLPGDFPKAVPVTSGKVISGLGLGSGAKEVWNVTIQIPGADTSGSIKTQLTGAGFKVQESGTSDAGDSLVATSSKYGVLVVTSKDTSKGYWIANYTVTPADSTN